MSQFINPQGVCFLFGDEVPAPVFSNVLCRIVNFLQDVEPYAKLQKYEDWWEHDGLHFYRSSMDFNALYGMISSPQHLLESTPADAYVFVGVASDDSSWYFRYRVEWDDEGFNLLGSCVITLPQSLAEKFRNEVSEKLDIKVKEEDSETYYQEVFG